MTGGRTIARLHQRINWPLLVFLLLFLDVKLWVKGLALLLVYCRRPDFRFGLSWKETRLPLFYPALMLITALDWLVYRGWISMGSSVSFIFALCWWLAPLLAAHQLKLFVERDDRERIHRTLMAFFLLNALVSCAQLGSIIFETGAINPYRYQGGYQKYFISTGDYIKGISFDTSTTNAVINAFGVLLFLRRNQTAMVLLCTAILLLTASNLTNVLLFAVLIALFIFSGSRRQRSTIIVCSCLLVIFLAKISPQNNQYIAEAVEKYLNHEPSKSVAKKPLPEQPDSLLSLEERRRKFALHYLDSAEKARIAKSTPVQPQQEILVAAAQATERPELPQPNIHTPPFQHRDDTDARRKELLLLAEKDTTGHAYPQNRPGKLLGLTQTWKFFKDHPAKIITGAGAGNFSSKLAFKSSGLKMAGGYPARFVHIDPYFRDNHLDLYAYFFSRRSKLHSAMNSPNSVYDQMLGEYGLLGIGALAVLYFGFFLRTQNRRTAWPMLALLAGVFAIDYWFEQLSVVILAELIFFSLNSRNTA